MKNQADQPQLREAFLKPCSRKTPLPALWNQLPYPETMA